MIISCIGPSNVSCIVEGEVRSKTALCSDSTSIATKKPPRECNNIKRRRRSRSSPVRYKNGQGVAMVWNRQCTPTASPSGPNSFRSSPKPSDNPPLLSSPRSVAYFTSRPPSEPMFLVPISLKSAAPLTAGATTSTITTAVTSVAASTQSLLRTEEVLVRNPKKENLRFTQAQQMNEGIKAHNWKSDLVVGELLRDVIGALPLEHEGKNETAAYITVRHGPRDRGAVLTTKRKRHKRRKLARAFSPARRKVMSDMSRTVATQSLSTHRSRCGCSANSKRKHVECVCRCKEVSQSEGQVRALRDSNVRMLMRQVQQLRHIERLSRTLRTKNLSHRLQL